MAISVNTVYQRVLGVLNKEQRGYVTAKEFNLFANQAQQDLFEQYFYDINQFGSVPGNDTEYSDMLTLLNEKINIFETISAPTRPANYFIAPSDMYRLGSNSKFIKIIDFWYRLFKFDSRNILSLFIFIFIDCLKLYLL